MNQASKAVKLLRKSLKLTQQRFSVEVLGCAITTVARYETSREPSGLVLLQLARIAEENQKHHIAEKFRKLYMKEVSYRFPGTFKLGDGKTCPTCGSNLQRGTNKGAAD